MTQVYWATETHSVNIVDANQHSGLKENSAAILLHHMMRKHREGCSEAGRAPVGVLLSRCKWPSPCPLHWTRVSKQNWLSLQSVRDTEKALRFATDWGYKKGGKEYPQNTNI